MAAAAPQFASSSKDTVCCRTAGEALQPHSHCPGFSAAGQGVNTHKSEEAVDLFLWSLRSYSYYLQLFGVYVVLITTINGYTSGYICLS